MYRFIFRTLDMLASRVIVVWLLLPSVLLGEPIEGNSATSAALSDRYSIQLPDSLGQSTIVIDYREGTKSPRVPERIQVTYSGTSYDIDEKLLASLSYVHRPEIFRSRRPGKAVRLTVMVPYGPDHTMCGDEYDDPLSTYKFYGFTQAYLIAILNTELMTIEAQEAVPACTIGKVRP